MELAPAARWNRAFDLLPGLPVHLGAREVPVARLVAIVGVHVALLVAVLTALRAGVAVLEVLGLAAVAGALLLGYALVTGRKRPDVMEHLWVVFGVVVAYLLAVGTPVWPGSDVVAVASCAVLAASRVGCLAVGCCHGLPAPVGVRYPGPAGPPERLRGIRLFPVPLVEAAALLVIGLVGFVLAGGRPGTATVWVLAACAVVRFGTEAWRGGRRPTVAGVSAIRVMAVVQLAAAVAADQLRGAAGVIEGRHAAAAVVLGAAGVAGLVLARRRWDPLATPEHLDELWSTIVALGATAPADTPPPVATTSQSVHLATSRTDDGGLHVSLSHPTRDVENLLRGMALEAVARTATAVHALVPAARLGGSGGATAAPGPAADPTRAVPTRAGPARCAGYFGDAREIP